MMNNKETIRKRIETFVNKYGNNVVRETVAFIKTGETEQSRDKHWREEANQLIDQLLSLFQEFADEVIGETREHREHSAMACIKQTAKDRLRTDQRKRAKELLGERTKGE